MSVTFHLRIDDTDLAGFEVKNWETNESHMFPNYDAACIGWHNLGATPGDWSLTPAYSVTDEFNVNMSNGNARDVLDSLGLITPENESDWYSGEVEADDLIGRCLIGIAVTPEVELPAAMEVGSKGARLMHPRRDASYIATKCVAIMRLAEEAKKLDRTIVWT